MKLAARVAVAVVALLHLGFFALESLLWQTPAVREALKMSAEQASSTAVFAINQGAYNAAFAAGLAIALWHPAPPVSLSLTRFLLGSIAVLSVVGAVTGGVGILVVQGLPALVAWGLTELAARRADSDSVR